MTSVGVPYNVDTKNISTLNNETVLITHQLVVEEIPTDVGNTDVVTVDNFNRIHKLPIASLPPSLGSIDFIANDILTNNITSYDGTNLNKSIATTNTAGDIITPNNLSVSGNAEIGNIPLGTYPPSTLKINSTHSQLSTYDDSNIPLINISSTTPFTNKNGSVNFGCYEDNTGIFRMSDNSKKGMSIFTTDTDGWIGTLRENPAVPNEAEVVTNINFRTNYNRFYVRTFMGDGLTLSGVQPAKICAFDGTLNECRVLERADLFGQDLKKNSDCTFNKLGINISPTAGSPLGIFKLSNLSSPAPNWGTRAHWYISDEGAGGTRPFLTINASRNFDQSITWGNYWSGTAWTSSDSLDSFKWQRNQDKMFFGVSFGPQIGGTPVIEKLPCYMKANSNIGFYIDGTQDGGLYLLSPDVNNLNNRILTINGSGKVQETALSSLNFNDLQLGDQTAQTTETTSQLRIVRPAIAGGLPSVDGSAFQMYIDTNIYPKYENLVIDTNHITTSY
jgi:hypothetical protein